MGINDRVVEEEETMGEEGEEALQATVPRVSPQIIIRGKEECSRGKLQGPTGWGHSQMR